MTASPPLGRYAGTEREAGNGRTRTIILSVLGALFGLGVAWLGYQNLAAAPVSGEQVGFTLLDDSSVRVRFDVTRSDPSRPAVCILRARSADGTETGRREVYVPPSADTVSTLEAVVRTSRPPVASNVYGCGLSVPAYLNP